MSTAGFWIGFGIGGLLSAALIVAEFVDLRGGFFGMPRRTFGQMQATLSMGGTVRSAARITLSPFVCGALGFIVGAVLDLARGLLS